MTTSYLNVSTASQFSADIKAIDLASQADGWKRHTLPHHGRGRRDLDESADTSAINLLGSDTLTINGQGRLPRRRRPIPRPVRLFGLSNDRELRRSTMLSPRRRRAARRGGGGGGAGLGGGLSVASGANVTLKSGRFHRRCSAKGGGGGTDAFTVGGGGGGSGRGWRRRRRRRQRRRQRRRRRRRFGRFRRRWA